MEKEGQGRGEQKERRERKREEKRRKENLITAIFSSSTWKTGGVCININ